MRLHGYCLRCRRCRLVTVVMMMRHLPVGNCDECLERP